MNVEKNNAKNVKKVFTKNNKKDIMSEKNNLFTASDKKHLRKKGLLMKITYEEDIVLKDIMEELNFIEKIIVKIFSKTFIKVYNKTRIKIVNSMLK